MTTALPTLEASSSELEAGARLRRRRGQRLQMLAMIAVSYGVDVTLMLAMAAVGAIGWTVGLYYGGAALVVCGGFWLAYASGWTERFRDHYIVVPQVAAHVALNLACIALVPQIGVLMLMVLFIVMSFGALRMAIREVVGGLVALSLLIGLVVALIGEDLALPTATPVQRLLSGIWFGLVLARTAGLGVYGARLRMVLAERNAQLANTSRRLELLATHDDLTGALNRRRMMQLLHEEHQRLLRTGRPFAVALLDLDHFKRVNDRYGHQVGDEVLRRVASLLTSHRRNTDRFGRHGGEEFLLLLPDTSDLSEASAVVQYLRSVTSRSHWEDIAPGLEVTVSAGVAVCSSDERVERLLQRADTALYEAKATGRDRVCAG